MTHHARRPAMATAVVLVSACLLLTLAGCGSNSRPAQGPRAGAVDVVAAENFWGDITKQIGGDHVNVTSVITDPNADPHLYESDARTAAALSKAQIVIVNGLGYDDFVGKLLSASPNPSRTVLTAADLMHISGSGANPHIWYDIAKVPQVSSAIAAQLAALDPSDAAAFTAGAKTFGDSLSPITDAIANIRAKHAGSPVGYTERVPGYLIEAAGLKVATPESFARAIENGNDPSPADNSAMNAAVKDKAIKVLLYDAQVTSPATDALKGLARQAGIPVVGVTETMPSSDASFQAWQLRQVNELAGALGQ
ncbi:metal ABC transporter solute-binding protein, Zn/Mn family [Mycobacterium sp. Marseille-P9652]|uniref:metal ABC transporter solute-binding protein, Zn/Mn family n=1 Tax=Mycobacterium sp. Marseille-P9652 TaxID=2654950 RepID=UPI001E4968C2|nr:zinc ABC transporter substrate-binding protein [Mycobacterium sp. Marseille-P9652]